MFNTVQLFKKQNKKIIQWHLLMLKYRRRYHIYFEFFVSLVHNYIMARKNINIWKLKLNIHTIISTNFLFNSPPLKIISLDNNQHQKTTRIQNKNFQLTELIDTRLMYISFTSFGNHSNCYMCSFLYGVFNYLRSIVFVNILWLDLCTFHLSVYNVSWEHMLSLIWRF